MEGAGPGGTLLRFAREGIVVSNFGGDLIVGAQVREGWWLVVDDEDAPDRRELVAGPFPDRAEASWALLPYADAGRDDMRAVYGASTGNGVLLRRPSPEEWTWLAHLGDQLERLGDDWNGLLTDTEPLATLAVEITAALCEAGLPLHDCGARTPTGVAAAGVCLTPDPSQDGVIVGWRQHDRMSVEQVHGPALDAAVQGTMNAALAEVLAAFGFVVTPFGGATGHLVRADEG
jgi:hypothetical protein